ncbi:MAG: hypothetical protein KBH08_06445 [Brachymonas sp.]|nr:hypothetical protein [Brachymonas sp.]
MTTRIVCSPLTGRISSGRVHKSGQYFVGQKSDVTSDVLRAVIEKAEFHGGKFDVAASDGQKWIVSVVKEATK